ncbi:DUF4292 domain-containing protein [candidate division CSSED10-310 bacterium]|uniref:DUF4292 domain-containing protein n=1 Tax=candidate division CSSED10-310 bacterium TaxID=2855610 RepID=A0ABV6Z075_UNCC1
MKFKTRSGIYILILSWFVVTTSLSFVPGYVRTGIAGDQDLQSQLLDRWVSALGGRERLARIKSIHSISTVKMLNLEGTCEEWFTAQGYHRLEFDLAGIISMVLVRTPNHCWFLGPSEKVIEQTGKELEDEIRDVFFGTWSHLLPGRMAGEVDRAKLNPENKTWRIRLHPQGGTAATFTIDPSSHLPVSSESTDESNEKMITTFSDWKTFDGVLFPARIEVFTTDSDNIRLIELREIHLNETLSPDTFKQPVARQTNISYVSDRSSRDIPLDIQGVHLFLQCWVNDSEPLWFLLDTGASISIIDRDLAQKLGFELTGRISGTGTGEKQVEVNFIQNAAIRLRGVKLPAQTIAAISLRNALEVGFGREVAGILGYDFIKCFVVEIDYEKKKLQLHDPETWVYQGHGTEIPVRFLNNKPVCDGSITMPGGKSIKCVLRFDTGSSVALRFNKPFTVEHDLLAALPKKLDSRGGGIGGETSNYLGRIVAVQIGNLVFKNPVCSFSQSETGIGADPSHAGKLGGTILERCTVILDYKRERIYLEPNARFGAPFHGEMCGLAVRSAGRGDWHTFTVSFVFEDSPAARAGVKPADLIISIDGRPATEFHLRDLHKMLQDQGRKIKLGFRRGVETFVAELHLKPLL